MLCQTGEGADAEDQLQTDPRTGRGRSRPIFGVLCRRDRFSVLFDRPEERFAFLDLAGIHIMLEEAAGPGRRFRTAPLEFPYGRGVNFQMEVADVTATYERAYAAHAPAVLIPLEERWYRQDQIEHGNRQFVIADPDGYLLRFYSYLGRRNVE